MEKYLYHATLYDFQQFHPNLHWETTGHAYGKGIYLIGDDFGAETDFYQDTERDIEEPAISVNGSAYIPEKYYWQTVIDSFENPAQHTPQYIILRTLYEYARENKEITPDAVFEHLKSYTQLREQTLRENKDYILNVSRFFEGKKFQETKISQHLEGRLLKVKLLSDKHIINGMLTLKENGIQTLDAATIYRTLSIKKPDITQPTTRKEVISFLYEAQDWLNYFLKLQKGDLETQKAFHSLEKLTLRLNKKSHENRPEDTNLTLNHKRAIQLTDMLIVPAFLNIRYLYLARVLEHTLVKELGIKGMYFSHLNRKNSLHTQWYVIKDPSVLTIVAYKNPRTNWEWKPLPSKLNTAQHTLLPVLSNDRER